MPHAFLKSDLDMMEYLTVIPDAVMKSGMHNQSGIY